MRSEKQEVRSKILTSHFLLPSSQLFKRLKKEYLKSFFDIFCPYNLNIRFFNVMEIASRNQPSLKSELCSLFDSNFCLAYCPQFSGKSYFPENKSFCIYRLVFKGRCNCCNNCHINSGLIYFQPSNNICKNIHTSKVHSKTFIKNSDKKINPVIVNT